MSHKHIYLSPPNVLLRFILQVIIVGSQLVLVVKNPPANAGDIRDLGLIPGLGRSPGEGNGYPLQWGLPWWLSGKEPTCQCRGHKRLGFDPWVRKIPWRKKWQPTPVIWPGESLGQRSLEGYSLWGHRVGHD